MHPRFSKSSLSMAACALACMLGACTHIPINAPRSSDIPPAINVNGIMVSSVNQLTLYTHRGDGHRQSNCMQECITRWLPFYASEHDTDRGDFSVFIRPDGRKQWALAGQPLYFWNSETRPEPLTEITDDPQWEVFRVNP